LEPHCKQYLSSLYPAHSVPQSLPTVALTSMSASVAVIHTTIHATRAATSSTASHAGSAVLAATDTAHGHSTALDKWTASHGVPTSKAASASGRFVVRIFFAIEALRRHVRLIASVIVLLVVVFLVSAAALHSLVVFATVPLIFVIPPVLASRLFTVRSVVLVTLPVRLRLAVVVAAVLRAGVVWVVFALVHRGAIRGTASSTTTTASHAHSTAHAGATSSHSFSCAFDGLDSVIIVISGLATLSRFMMATLLVVASS